MTRLDVDTYEAVGVDADGDGDADAGASRRDCNMS